MNTTVDLDYPACADDHQRLEQEITLLAGQLNAGGYRLLHLIAKLDDSKAWCGAGTVRSCAHWLNWKCGIAMGAAREKVRVANCLRKLPLIDESFSIGEISYSKVRAMTRVATPQNEDFLLMVARHGTASHMEKVVGKYQNVQRTMEGEADGEGGQEEIDQRDARKLVYYQDEDGMWVIHAKLPPEEGSLVVKAIEALATPVQEEKQKGSQEERQGEIKEVGVSAETFSEETLSEEVDKSDEGDHRDTFGHTRADALVAMAEHLLATSDQNTQFMGLKGSERCEIVLHVDINTLRRQSDVVGEANKHCHLGDKQWVSPKTARRLACDASLVTVLENERGDVLNIGRRARTVPASIKRALAIRDKTCVFPGCCESRYLDSHHIRHWADGGETSLANLATMCRYHHRLLHKGAFDMRVESSGELFATSRLVFSTPSGKEIETSFFPQFPAQAAASGEESLRNAAPTVNANTCVPHWTGEYCGYGMAVDALLARDGGHA